MDPYKTLKLQSARTGQLLIPKLSNMIDSQMNVPHFVPNTALSLKVLFIYCVCIFVFMCSRVCAWRTDQHGYLPQSLFTVGFWDRLSLILELPIGLAWEPQGLSCLLPQGWDRHESPCLAFCVGSGESDLRASCCAVSSLLMGPSPRSLGTSL